MCKIPLAYAAVLASALYVGSLAPAAAVPKSGPKGQQCISTGTERRTGDEVDGNGNPTGRKFDCLYDYCEYCQDGSDNIACGSRGKTYDNATDCKQVASRPGGAVVGPQTIDPGVLVPETSTPPPRGPRGLRPGGTLRRN